MIVGFSINFFITVQLYPLLGVIHTFSCFTSWLFSMYLLQRSLVLVIRRQICFILVDELDVALSDEYFVACWFINVTCDMLQTLGC